MLERFPCLSWMYAMKDAKSRYYYFLDVLYYAGIDRLEARKLFCSFPNGKELFDKYCDAEESAFFEAYSNRTRIPCDQLLKSYSESIKGYRKWICRACPSSNLYKNMFIDEEAILIIYLLKSQNYDFIKKYNITFQTFRYTFVSIANKVGSRTIVVTLFAKTFVHLKNRLKSGLAYNNTGASISRILNDMRASQGFLSSLYEGTKVEQTIVFDYLMQILSDCEKRYSVIKEREALDALGRITGNSLSDDIEMSSESESTLSLPLSNFLGVASDKTIQVSLKSAENNDKKITGPLLSSDDVINMIEAGCNPSDGEGVSVVSEATPDAEPVKEPSTASTEGNTSLSEENKEQGSDSFVKATETVVEPDEQDMLPLEQQYPDICADTAFLEDGYVDVTESISLYQMQAVHGEDLLHFMRHLYKSDWIAVEAAVYGDTKGLCVYGGNNKVCGFIEEDYLDEGTLDLLFNTSSFEVITQNLPLIASYMARAEKYADTNLYSLTAMHKTLTGSDVLYPYLRFHSLTGIEIDKTGFTPLLYHLSMYGVFKEQLIKLIEKKNKRKTYVNFYNYEYALGTSYFLNDILKMGFKNLTRKDFLQNTFGYLNLHTPRKKGVVMKVTYQLKLESNFSDMKKLYTLSSYILAFMIKNTVFRTHPIRLVSAEPGEFYIFIPTKDRQFLNILEEYVGINITKRCSDFNLGVPKIDIVYIH